MNVAKLDAVAGSSPLARGTLEAGEKLGMIYRFIPAGAGNTLRSRFQLRMLAVHPRWRGEHAWDEEGFTSYDGSSPLARGTHQLPCCGVVCVRFIPAGAGNTPTNPGTTCAWTVHPRWRGEHDWYQVDDVGISGSSPLARGTLVRFPR